MRILLLVNPHATRVTPRRRAAAERILGVDHEVTVAATAHRGHATELAERAVERGIECVVVLGGDGTVNEVAVALADTACVLACLPGGGTNVLARTLGISDDVTTAAEGICDALGRGAIERIGLGSVNGRYFTFHTGVGWDAALVSVVERHQSLKRRFGHALFVYAGVATFFGRYDRRHPHFMVEVDGMAKVDGTVDVEGEGQSERADGEKSAELPEPEAAFFALVMNSDPYTFVRTRPFTISPETRLDGPLTVVVLKSMRIRHFLTLMISALRNRDGVSDRPWFSVHRGVTHATIRRITDPVPREMEYQVDGDHLGGVDELRFRHHPDALSIVVPVDTSHEDRVG